MNGRWPGALLMAALLAAPLIGLTAWVVDGAIHQSHDVSVPESSAPGRAGRPPASILPGLPAPEADLAADKLEDRVDGAAEYLRAHGCQRLVYWRLENPAADLEVLVFAAPGEASTVLTRDAGPDRNAGPGDESQVTAQAIYFRRGRHLVRLFADPGAADGAAALPRRASEIDRALSERRDLLAPTATPTSPEASR